MNVPLLFLPEALQIFDNPWPRILCQDPTEQGSCTCCSSTLRMPISTTAPGRCPSPHPFPATFLQGKREGCLSLISFSRHLPTTGCSCRQLDNNASHFNRALQNPGVHMAANSLTAHSGKCSDQKLIREWKPWFCQKHSIMLGRVGKQREENRFRNTKAVLWARRQNEHHPKPMALVSKRQWVSALLSGKPHWTMVGKPSFEFCSSMRTNDAFLGRSLCFSLLLPLLLRLEWDGPYLLSVNVHLKATHETMNLVLVGLGMFVIGSVPWFLDYQLCWQSCPSLGEFSMNDWNVGITFVADVCPKDRSKKASHPTCSLQCDLATLAQEVESISPPLDLGCDCSDQWNVMEMTGCHFQERSYLTW